MRGRTLWLATCCAILCACGSNGSEPLKHSASVNAADHVIALRGGGTVVAPKDSVARQLAEWANKTGNETRRFELGGNQFPGKSSEPTGELRARLVAFEALMGSDPNLSAKVVGYTDSTGDAAANQRISEERAKRIFDELRQNGMPTARVTYEGRGSAEPVADNATEEGRARNERVALIMTKES